MVRGTLVRSDYAGGERSSHFELPTGHIMVAKHTTEGEEKYPLGTELCLWWNPETASLLQPEEDEAAS